VTAFQGKSDKIKSTFVTPTLRSFDELQAKSKETTEEVKSVFDEGFKDFRPTFMTDVDQYIKDLEESLNQIELESAQRKWEIHKESQVTTAEQTTDRIRQEDRELSSFLGEVSKERLAQQTALAEKLKNTEKVTGDERLKIVREDWEKTRARIRKEANDSVTIIDDAAGKVVDSFGTFTDESLAVFEASIPGLAAYNRRIAAELKKTEELAKKELDVPDDTKFKAAQNKLLKEIEVNGRIMESSIKATADTAESRAKTISEAFEAVKSSIEGTGTTLRSLYSELSSGRLDIQTQSRLQRQITLEEERREEAFNLQQQLTTAQLDLIKQRTSAMAAGDPMITISGDGLQPHLEAFMWEILSAIQVRVNEDYGAYLLGIGATV
jgi:hypothetical protein